MLLVSFFFSFLFSSFLYLLPLCVLLLPMSPKMWAFHCFMWFKEKRDVNSVPLIRSLCLIKHRLRKGVWCVAMWLHTFITLALDGSELSSFCLGHLTHHENALPVSTGRDAVDKSCLPAGNHTIIRQLFSPLCLRMCLKFTGPEGQRVRLICIPTFSKTHSCVVVNLNNLDCYPVCFGTYTSVDSGPDK